jgi:hypothetical protein
MTATAKAKHINNMLKTINEISGQYNRPVYLHEIIESHYMDYTLCSSMRSHIKSCRALGLIEMTERTALLGERYRLTDTGKDYASGVI